MANIYDIAKLLESNSQNEVLSRAMGGRHEFILAFNSESNEYQCEIYMNIDRITGPYKFKGFEIFVLQDKILICSISIYNREFLSMINDIYHKIQSVSDDELFDWIMEAIKRLKAYYKFNTQYEMTRDLQMGLFGELCTVLDFYDKGYEDILRGWKGPLREPQDFFISNHSYEVKTIGLHSEEIRINGARQLHSSYPLTLIVVMIDEIEDGISVHDLVQMINGRLDGVELELFNELLIKYGYLEMQQNVFHYAVCRISKYNVEDEFPRLPLVKGVSKVGYNIDLLECEPYKIVEIVSS